MSLEQLTPRQVKIVRQLRTLILDTLANANRTVGKTMLISDIYRALSQHFAVPVDKLVSLGNELIWSALYLLELQGWIRLESHFARVMVLREKQLSAENTQNNNANLSEHIQGEPQISNISPYICQE